MKDDRPLPTTAIQASEIEIPALHDKDALLAQLRDFYVTGIAEIMDRAMAELILPQDKEALVHDALAFMTLWGVNTIHGLSGGDPSLGAMMGPFRRLQKHVEKFVPAALVDLARAQRQQEG